MVIALILPVYNHIGFTKTTLNKVTEQIDRIHDHTFHFILIDDGSSDGTSDWVRQYYPNVKLLSGDGNLWWSGAVNLGVRYALHELEVNYVLLWNNDIAVEEGYFSTLLQVLKDADNHVVLGSKILIKEDPSLIWSMGGYFNPTTGKYGMYGYYEKDSAVYNSISRVDWLTGMGTVIHRSVIEKIGYWDSVNFPQYHGDSDFTYRAKKNGFEIIVNPALKIYNSVKSSGIEHEGNLKQLIGLMTNIRSKSNLKKNLMFYKLHAESFRAYFPLCWSYFRIFGGFFKWKVFEFFGQKRKI